MDKRVILRLVNKIINYNGSKTYRITTVTGVQEYIVKEYTVELKSFIIQIPGSSDVYSYHNRMITIAPPPWKSYCRWHDGPLEEKDDPTKRLYCTVEAEGYCRFHRRSERALYDICMSTSGLKALEACKHLDKIVKTEYALYMLDYGKPTIKVGVTRAFRLLERIAEQPHVAAILLNTYDSAYHARKAEMLLSKKGFAVERKRVNIGKLRFDVASAVNRLYTLASLVAKELGFALEGSVFRIRGNSDFTGIVRVESHKLYYKPVKVAGYWGGFIFLQDQSRINAIYDRELLHRDSIIAEV